MAKPLFFVMPDQEGRRALIRASAVVAVHAGPPAALGIELVNGRERVWTFKTTQDRDQAFQEVARHLGQEVE